MNKIEELKKRINNSIEEVETILEDAYAIISYINYDISEDEYWKKEEYYNEQLSNANEDIKYFEKRLEELKNRIIEVQDLENEIDWLLECY